MGYSVVSLFSGALGLDLGFKATGRFDLRACVEHSAAACATIRANQKEGRIPAHTKVFQADMNNFSPADLLAALGLGSTEVDVLIGGPPCQSFSYAGSRGGLSDPRGSLIWRFLDFVFALNPKVFVMENVPGLLTAKLPEGTPGSVLQAYLDRVSTCPEGYRVDGFKVNAVNYGAPQFRERVIFCGNRLGRQVSFPEPTHGLFGLPWMTLGDALKDLHDPAPVRMEFSPRKRHYLSMVPPGANWRSLPVDIQRESMGAAWYAKGGRSGWWRRLSLDLPSPTLVTLPNHASTSLCHPLEVRALTLREYARIQEFPDNWEFCGTPKEQFSQVGNAVPVRLGTVVGRTVAWVLDQGFGEVENGRSPNRIVDVHSCVRSR